MELPKRKSLRLQDYDYSQTGAYFVTICTHKRRNILSEINVGQGLAPAENRLSEYGKIAKEQLYALEQRYAEVKIDKFVIMPNHIHMILLLEQNTAGASPCPTLSSIICAYKSLTTRSCKQYAPIDKLFQNSFYDHVIRGEKDYLEIWEYIDSNPLKWREDSLYCD